MEIEIKINHGEIINLNNNLELKTQELNES